MRKLSDVFPPDGPMAPACAVSLLHIAGFAALAVAKEPAALSALHFQLLAM